MQKSWHLRCNGSEICAALARSLPFRNIDGEIAAGEPQEYRDAFKARSVAAILASDPNNCGAVAFSRTGDAALGEFDDAIIIARLGEVDDTLT